MISWVLSFPHSIWWLLTRERNCYAFFHQVLFFAKLNAATIYMCSFVSILLRESPSPKNLRPLVPNVPPKLRNTNTEKKVACPLCRTPDIPHALSDTCPILFFWCLLELVPHNILKVGRLGAPFSPDWSLAISGTLVSHWLIITSKIRI